MIGSMNELIKMNNIFSQLRKYIQICGEPMAEYENFLKIIFIYKLIIQYILWIPTLRCVQTT